MAKKISEITGSEQLGGSDAVWSVPGAFKSKNLTDGKNIRFMGGVIRGNGNGTTAAWAFLADSVHTQFGFSAIECDATKIRVSWPMASKVKTFLAVPDETYAANGYQMGASVSVGYADIYMYQQGKSVSGYITGSASSASNAFSSSYASGITSVTYAQDTGIITITHSDLLTVEYNVNLTPRAEMGALRPVISSFGNTTTLVKILNADGTVRTGEASVNDRFSFSRFISRSTIDPRTLNVIGSNIWLFCAMED